MTATPIDITAIDVGGRLRALDPSWVALLAEEIAVDGLIEPIRVVERGAGYKLIDGARRIAAHLALGWDSIEAQIEPASALADDAAVRLAEIKGNMLRGELTALDHAVYVAAWCDIYRDAKEPAKRGRKKVVPDNDGGLEELSAKLALNWTPAAQAALNISRRTVFRSIKIASIAVGLRSRLSLHPVADHQSELLILADQPETRQLSIVEMLTAEPAKAETVSEALSLLNVRPAAQETPVYAKLSERFSRLPEKEQHAFFALHQGAIDLWIATRRTKAA